MGEDREGQERRVGSFKDGIMVQKAEIVDRRIIVTDPLNKEYYRSDQIPELTNYAVQQINCNRSSQTGMLIITLGGFYVGGHRQQAITLSTDYRIKQEVVLPD